LPRMIGQAPGVADAELAADPPAPAGGSWTRCPGTHPRTWPSGCSPSCRPTLGCSNPSPIPTGYPWLGEADLSYHAEQFGRTGFTGALNRYRNVDRDWHELPELGVTTVAQPVLFITGELDTATRLGSLDAMRACAQPLGAGGAPLQGAYSPC
jgi:hypothetical protein